MDNTLFSFNNYNVMIILWHVKCKESIAVIKLQMADIQGWVSKVGEKAIVRASDKVQEKF